MDFRRVKLRPGGPTSRAYQPAIDWIGEKEATSLHRRLVVLRCVSHPPAILYAFGCLLHVPKHGCQCFYLFTAHYPPSNRILLFPASVFTNPLFNSLTPSC